MRTRIHFSTRSVIASTFVAIMAVTILPVVQCAAQIVPDGFKKQIDPPASKQLPGADSVTPNSVAKAKPPQLGKTIPETAVARAKLLDDLYAHLSTASDEDSAKPLMEAIERLWLAPGSDTVLVLMDRAAAAAGHKRSDLALTLLTKVVELAPDFTEAWNRRAYVFYSEGDYERALGDLRRVLALDPNHVKALDGTGQILRELGFKAQALQAYQRVLIVHPFWPGAQAVVEELKRDVEGRAL